MRVYASLPGMMEGVRFLLHGSGRGEVQPADRDRAMSRNARAIRFRAGFIFRASS
jgi:hypothetical protein